MKAWAARDESGDLWIYFDEAPCKRSDHWDTAQLRDAVKIDGDLLPEVRWLDDEPVEIEIGDAYGSLKDSAEFKHIREDMESLARKHDALMDILLKEADAWMDAMDASNGRADDPVLDALERYRLRASPEEKAAELDSLERGCRSACAGCHLILAASQEKCETKPQNHKTAKA